MMVTPFPVPTALATLGQAYENAGHQIWLVGGCVRDHIMGKEPKDIDLATSATPEEQVALCKAAGYRWFGTGLQHGTLTVLAGGEPYEITTFRTDLETDGRHATVSWTRDIATDLARRDLTVNAIAMSLNGEIIDPFNGVEHIHDRRIQFVGNASTRIEEDHLRILRWFRFFGNFGENANYPVEDLQAIATGAHMLSRISVERIWSEVSRILAGPNPGDVLAAMDACNVLKVLSLPSFDAPGIRHMLEVHRYTRDPAMLLGAWLGANTKTITKSWKASSAEQAAASFMADRIGLRSYTTDDAKLDLINDFPRDWIDTALRCHSQAVAADALKEWTIPTIPVTGDDLKSLGMVQGLALGQRLKAMRQAWIDSDYSLTHEQLLAIEICQA